MRRACAHARARRAHDLPAQLRGKGGAGGRPSRAQLRGAAAAGDEQLRLGGRPAFGRRDCRRAQGRLHRVRLQRGSNARWACPACQPLTVRRAPRNRASLMMFRALGLLHEARGYIRSYACDGWDCKPGVHWVGDYRVNVFGANASHKVGPLEKACSRFCTSGSGVRFTRTVSSCVRGGHGYMGAIQPQASRGGRLGRLPGKADRCRR